MAEMQKIQPEEEISKLHKIYDHGPLVVMKWYDAEKEVFDYISESISIYGYKASLFTQRMLNYRDIIHPDDLKTIIRQRFDHIKTNHTSYFQQYRILCPSEQISGKNDPAMAMLLDRNQILASANSAKIRWIVDKTEVFGVEENDTMKFVGYLIDISQQKDLEYKIAKQIAQVNSERQARTLFLLSLTYETKEPLHRFGEALNLMASSPLRTDQESHITYLGESIERLKHCIGQIEEYIDLDSLTLEINKTPYPISDLFTPSIEAYSRLCSHANLSFEHELPEDDYQVFCSKDLTARSAELVLENALKFTTSGKISFNVFFTPFNDLEGKLTVEVVDTGIGIPETIKPKIFEPFNQIDNSYTREFGGLGLGLATLSKILEITGGNVIIDSKEDCGTHVSIHWIKRYLDKGDLS